MFKESSDMNEDVIPFIKQKNIRAIQNLSLMKTFVIKPLQHSSWLVLSVCGRQ